MNDREELMKHYEEMIIGMDEPFKFHCTQCGKCCLHREDILLTAKDLFQIARKFQVKPAEVLEQYCETYIGPDSRLPIVRVKSRGNVKRCVFLKDRKCAIHDVKPVVCAIFPIGRVFKLEPGEDTSQSDGMLKVQYIFTNPGCGDDSKQHTVKEWLSDFNIPLEDWFFSEWSRITILLSKYIKMLEGKVSEETMLQMWNTALSSLYLAYDINKDFQIQFQANAEKILEVFRTIAELGEKLLIEEATV